MIHKFILVIWLILWQNHICIKKKIKFDTLYFDISSSCGSKIKVPNLTTFSSVSSYNPMNKTQLRNSVFCYQCWNSDPCPYLLSPCLTSNLFSPSFLPNPEPCFTLRTQDSSFRNRFLSLFQLRLRFQSLRDTILVLILMSVLKLNPTIFLAVCLREKGLKWLFFWVAALIAALLFGFFMPLAIPALLFTSKSGFKYVCLFACWG